MKIKTFNPEGVLIIANMTKCKEYYSDKEFNYDYPEGLSDLIQKGIVHIITTQETIKNLNFVFNKEEIDFDKWKYKESYNYLNVSKEDKVLLVPHGVFTRMCREWGKSDNITDGDVETFEFLKKMFTKQEKEITFTLDKILENRLKLRDEDEKKLYEHSPQINVEVGFNKVDIYTKKTKEITFLITKTDTVDFDKITVKPIEFIG